MIRDRYEALAFSLLLVFAVMATSPPVAQVPQAAIAQEPWCIVPVEQDIALFNPSPTIIADSSGLPHVSYVSNFHPPLGVKYASLSNGNWSRAFVETGPQTFGFTSVDFDNLESPHVAFVNKTNQMLMYASASQTGWDVETVDTFPVTNVEISLKLDSNDSPHIAYGQRDYGLRHAVFEDGLWNLSDSIDPMGGGRSNSIDIDKENRPHIAYMGFDQFEWTVNYTHFDGTSWVREKVEAVTWPHGISLSLDSNDVPHIVYADSEDDILKHAYRDQTGWTIEPVDYGRFHVNVHSFALDSKDMPHITYFDIVNEDLRYAHLEGGTWVNETVDSEGNTGRVSSVAVDLDDRPQVAYWDATADDLNYAIKGACPWENEAPVADAGPDQVVYEGDIVSFNGTGSHGSSVGLWEDSFGDDSKISEMTNTTILSESVVLMNLSLSIMHTFDTDPGFIIEDDMPNTVIRWDSAKKAIQWYVDREDPRDHYEKLVGFLPFPITDAMDISAQVDYMYWRADTYSIAHPLFLQKNESWRLDHKHVPANNTLVVRVYGGDPNLGDLDGLFSWMYDDSEAIHVTYITYYDNHYWELFTTRITWDSETRTMYGEVRNPLGNIVANGSSYIDENFTFSKYGVGSYGEGEIDGNPHIGEGFADNISISAFGYRTPGWVTSEVISPSGVLQSWGELDVSAIEPDRTEIEIQVLDEFGSPIVTGISPNDCPLSLDGLVDPILYPSIMLKAILTTERNETPSLLSWNVSFHLEEPLSYYWDMDHLVDSDGDGNYTNDVDATGPTPTHVYYDDGIYVVTLKVTDASGLSDWDTCNITVLNVPPTPEWTSRSLDGTILNPPYPEGKEILFEATVSDPGIYDTFTYDWDFGDGTILLDAGPSVTHTYGDDDIYIVVLTVTDDDGGVGIDDTPPLDTTNENPVASIDMPFCIFTEGTSPCEAIGQFTDPGWLDTHSAVWAYGDGTYETAVLTGENDPPDATGMNITSHIYGDDGTYVITFTVLDDDGGVGSASAEAQVQNLPPSLDMNAPSSVNEGEAFVLGITTTDPGSDDLIISIDWGDGTSDTETFYNNGVGPDPPNSGEGVYPFTVYSNLTHIYGDNGGFTVQVTVEDDDGGSVQDSAAIEVFNLPPEIVLLAVPLSVNEGEEFSVVAEATDQGSDDIEFSWTFELGPSMSTMYYNDGVGPDPLPSPWGTFPFTAEDTVNHTYGDNGFYNVTITVTDDDGGVSTSVFTIEIRNVNPFVDIEGPYAGNENSPIEFTAAVTDPGSDDLTLLWDWGDGTTDAMAFYNDGMGNDPPKSPWGAYPFVATHTLSHLWGDNGDFTVTLTVMDDDGGVIVEQTVVTVSNVAPTIAGIVHYLNASFAFRIAGEKWHNVEIYLYEDGTEVGYASITRYPGSPNEQMADFGEFSIDFSKTYSAVAYYTPEDDPVNGQIWGATPAWVILEYEDGEERIHHTFNVRHEDTWTWVIDDFSPYFLGHNITFMATASDPGSDDLTFTWNWGDGNTTENVYYNDGIGPDPYPSPEVNPITVTDTVEHSYASAGTYTVTLLVMDDDGGITSYSLNLTL